MVAIASLTMAESEGPVFRTMLPSSGAESLRRRRRTFTWTLSRKSRALRNIVGRRICTSILHGLFRLLERMQDHCVPATFSTALENHAAWLDPSSSVNASKRQSVALPNRVEMTTSAASRPRAITILPREVARGNIHAAAQRKGEFVPTIPARYTAAKRSMSRSELTVVTAN